MFWRHLIFERSHLLSRAWSSGGKVRHGRSGLQALRERVVRQERHGGRPPALPLQGVRPQLHGDAGARQAAGDEGAGGAALRARQRQPGHDRQAPRGEPRRGLQVGPRGRRGHAGAVGHTLRQHRADRRDVALRGREKNKLWVWRAFDPVARRTLAWELGGRDDATCRRLLDKVGVDGQRLPDRRLGGLPPADPGGTTLHRQGPDLPDRAGQRRGPPPPGPLPPPLQGHVPRPSHGRRGAQAALPPAPTRELPADARQLLIYFG